MDWRICTRQGDGNSELEFLSMGFGCGFFYTDGQDGEDGFYGMDKGDKWGFGDLRLDSGLRRNDGLGGGMTVWGDGMMVADGGMRG